MANNGLSNNTLYYSLYHNTTPQTFFLGGAERSEASLTLVDFRKEASKKIRGSPQTAEKKRVQMLQVSTRVCYTDILGNKHYKEIMYASAASI